MKPIIKKIISIALLSCLSSFSAYSIPWQKPEFYYFAQEEDLSDMLRNFCLSQGVNTVIDSRVQGKVSGLFEDISPDVFINQISKAYGLIWFYDGNVLYIDPFDTITSQIVQVQYYDANRLLHMLNALGIKGSNFVIKSLDQQGLMLISGSPKFVQMTQEILSKLESNEQQRQGQWAVGVYTLKNSWAYDLSLNYNNSSIKVPGLASIINTLMVGGELPSMTEEQIPAANMANKLTRLGADTPNPNQQYKPQSAISTANLDGSENKGKSSGVNNQNPTKKDDTKKSGNEVVIQPDVRLNAVIVRDIREKLPMYESLIKTLDVPVDVIDINVAIVTINTAFSRGLGNRFLGVDKGDFNMGVSTNGDFAPKSLTNPPTGTEDNFTIAAKFSAAQGAMFLNQVQALEKDGYGKVLSRPSVLTLDNVEAMLSSTKETFVPTSSTYDASLFSIQAGTVLRVTPHLIEENGVRKIRLLINIQDGSISYDTTTKQNSKTSSNISTQAVINEGESLLIGGYYTENKSKGYSGAPFLSNIPILGYLFKVDSRNSTTSEQMFLITPKVIRMTSSGDDSGYQQYFSKRLHNAEGTVTSQRDVDFDSEFLTEKKISKEKSAE